MAKRKTFFRALAMLEQDYRCVIVYSHGSAISATPWGVCEGVPMHRRRISDNCGYNGLTNLDTGVLIGNSSSSYKSLSTV